MTFAPAATSIRWLSFRNDSGEEVPGFAVLRPTGVISVEGQAVLTIAKPDSDGGSFYFFNGPFPVKYGKFGSGTADFPCFAAYDDSDAPQVGDVWGAKSGQWTLKKGNSGFKIVGGATNGRVLIVSTESPSNLTRFYLNGDLVRGGSQFAQVLEWSGTSWQPGATTIEVFDSSQIGPAKAADVGVCYLSPESNRYEIITLESIAVHLVMFSLTADLAQGASASAVIQHFVAGNWQNNPLEPITVFDSRGLGPAGQGTTGVAWLNAESGRYEIITLVSSGAVPFYLNESLAKGGAASAQVLEFDGVNWQPGATTITVNDGWIRLGPAPETARGLAVLIGDVFWVISLDDQENPIFGVEITEALARGGSADGNLLVWNAGAGAWQPTGAAVEVFDSFVRHGPAEAYTRVVVEQDPSSGRYEVISVDRDLAITHFRLTDQCSRGGSAPAVVRRWDGATWSDTADDITVFDSTNRGPANVDALGLALLDPDSNRYEVITFEADRPSFTFFKLTASLARGGSATAKQYQWNSGTNQYEEAAGTITVWDQGSKDGPSPAGIEGWAWQDPASGRWQIIKLRLDRVRMARLSEFLPLGGTAQAVLLNYAGGWQDDAAIVVTDETGRVGPANEDDIVWVCYSYLSGQYELLSTPRNFYWIVATNNWVNEPGNESYFLGELSLSRDGAPTLGLSVSCFLPRSGFGDPNVRQGDVVGAMLDFDGNWVAVTDYMDDKIGTVKMWVGNPQDVGRGWRIVDGMAGKFPVGVIDDSNFDDDGNGPTSPGATGGKKKHKHKYRENGIKTDPETLVISPATDLRTQPVSLTVPQHESFYTSQTELNLSAAGQTTAYITDVSIVGDNLPIETSNPTTHPTMDVVGLSGPGYGWLADTILDLNKVPIQVDWGVTQYGPIVLGYGTDVRPTSHTHELNIEYVTPGTFKVGLADHVHNYFASDIADHLSLTPFQVTIPAHTHSILPNPHDHWIEPLPHTITPNPHWHEVEPHWHDIDPNPHRHDLPDSPEANHIPPFYGIYFIERFE
jgi:hypothetical protein